MRFEYALQNLGTDTTKAGGIITLFVGQGWEFVQLLAFKGKYGNAKHVTEDQILGLFRRSVK